MAASKPTFRWWFRYQSCLPSGYIFNHWRLTK